MHKPTLLIGTLTLALFASSISPVPPTQDDEFPLADAMGLMNSGQRKLRRMLKKPEQKDETIAVIQTMQSASITAYGLAPPAPEDQTSDEAKAEWRIGFQRRILSVTDTLLELELAVVKGDSEAAQAAYTGLAAIKKGGHDTYQ